MSDENEWTVATLKAHYDTVLGLHEKAVEAALAAAEKAVEKAEKAAGERFNAVNEFRGQLNDQAATFMPRAEAESRAVSMDEKLAALTGRLDKLDGVDLGSAEVRRVGLAIAAIMVTAVGVAVAVLVAVLG